MGGSSAQQLISDLAFLPVYAGCDGDGLEGVRLLRRDRRGSHEASPAERRSIAPQSRSPAEPVIWYLVLGPTTLLGGTSWLQTLASPRRSAT
jgi:hypothetical protein